MMDVSKFVRINVELNQQGQNGQASVTDSNVNVKLIIESSYKKD